FRVVERPRDGRPVRTFPWLVCALLAFTSRRTGIFTGWVDAVRTQQATISCIHLNIIQTAIVGLPSRLLILTTRSITWLAACSPNREPLTSTAWAARQRAQPRLQVASSDTILSPTPSARLLLPGRPASPPS